MLLKSSRKSGKLSNCCKFCAEMDMTYTTMTEASETNFLIFKLRNSRRAHYIYFFSVHSLDSRIYNSYTWLNETFNFGSFFALFSRVIRSDSKKNH